MEQPWRKSSRSAHNGNCLEVTWRKSSLSGANGQCVETASTAGVIAVRDSKDPDGPVLRLTSSEWVAFLADVRRAQPH